ncbi:hypothetical protein FKM82_025405 [Ascaphus truei]
MMPYDQKACPEVVLARTDNARDIFVMLALRAALAGDQVPEKPLVLFTSDSTNPLHLLNTLEPETELPSQYCIMSSYFICLPYGHVTHVVLEGTVG